tara:strand:- start:1956 stop:2891 length:936 start_codon:yes stop_codon:yes gene_type:complete
MIRKKKPRRLTPIISNKIPVVFNFLNKKISPENNTVIKRDRLSPIQFTNNITRGLQSSRVKNIKKNICNKYRKKVLISFGINNYSKWSKLKNSINDVNAFSKFAKEKLKFDIIYTYNDYHVTKSSIEKIITHDLYQIANENDLIVMSFHGHGHSICFENFEEGFLVPYNAPINPTPFELVSMNNLSKWFKYIKSKHVLLLLDCCFSGLSVLRNKPLEHKIITPNALRRHLGSNSRIIINAGTRGDAVSDGGWNDNSVFTGALISSPTLDNEIGSVINLYYYLLTTVPRFSNQTPSIGKMEGDMGTDIFLKL